MAVTVIGGYLGAGKTTMLNDILRRADERVAVIVNDFGEINIDADLISRRDGQTMALANGCICCSLADGFAAALTTVSALRPRPARLIIEASGVADPAAVAAYGHAPGLFPDAIVVVADAETVVAKASDEYVGDTVRGQLDSADIVVLNKTDLVTSETLAHRHLWLSEHWPQAIVVDSVRGQTPLALVLADIDADDATTDVVARPAIAAGKRHRPASAAGPADATFMTWSIDRAEPLAERSVEALMERLPHAVVRAKGIIWSRERPDRQLLLQRVGSRWSTAPGDEWSAPPRSRLVLIGLAADPESAGVGELLDEVLGEAPGPSGQSG